MKLIRWGIIGCGNVTEVKSGPAFQKAEHSSLVAVMRRDAALAEDYAKRHVVPRWYQDAEALITDPEVDAIYIATPPAYHMEYTLAAAKAGKPVYVEKPMALNSQQCEAMILACQQASVPLFVAYYRRALPRFQKVKQLLESGALGQLRFVKTIHMKKITASDLRPDQLPWRLKPELSGGGLFFDVASHTLDLLDYLLGPIREVKGSAVNQAGLYAAEDLVNASYAFESGVQGTGTWCFTAYTNEDSNEIVGSDGKLVFSTFDDTPIQLTTSNGTEEWLIEHPPHIQQPLIQSVVKELLGSGRCLSTGQTAMRTNQVMDKMVESYYRS